MTKFFSSDFFRFLLVLVLVLVKMSFHVEFRPPGLPGTGQKVCVGGGLGCHPKIQSVKTLFFHPLYPYYMVPGANRKNN